MADQKRWLLPDGVDEVLPPRARTLEDLRRKLLDIFDRWGYELVMPPIVEYLDSLLSGERQRECTVALTGFGLLQVLRRSWWGLGAAASISAVIRRTSERGRVAGYPDGRRTSSRV